MRKVLLSTVAAITVAGLAGTASAGSGVKFMPHSETTFNLNAYFLGQTHVPEQSCTICDVTQTVDPSE